MKGLLKTIALVGMLASLGACSSYTTIAERDTYAQPKWYAKCAQAGSEGWLWWKKDYVYQLDFLTFFEVNTTMLFFFFFNFLSEIITEAPLSIASSI